MMGEQVGTLSASPWQLKFVYTSKDNTSCKILKKKNHYQFAHTILLICEQNSSYNSIKSNFIKSITFIYNSHFNNLIRIFVVGKRV